MNKFEQVPIDGHQISLVGGSHVWMGRRAGARVGGPHVPFLEVERSWGQYQGWGKVPMSHVWRGVGARGRACTVRSNASWVMVT